MPFALILDGRVRELFPDRPELHPSLEVVEVVETIEVGMIRHPNGQFTWPVPNFQERKAEMRGSADAKRNQILGAGYRHNFGGAAGVRTLDTRSEQDIMNWLVLKGIADSMIATGHDADLVQVRDANDRTFFASAQTVSAALVAMSKWRSSVMAHAWGLKDRIGSAASRTALDAIDINAGWPS